MLVVHNNQYPEPLSKSQIIVKCIPPHVYPYITGAIVPLPVPLSPFGYYSYLCAFAPVFTKSIRTIPATDMDSITVADSQLSSDFHI
jgi:hypothetical protein